MQWILFFHVLISLSIFIALKPKIEPKFIGIFALCCLIWEVGIIGMTIDWLAKKREGIKEIK
jgi:hypothetical protein